MSGNVTIIKFLWGRAHRASLHYELGKGVKI